MLECLSGSVVGMGKKVAVGAHSVTQPTQCDPFDLKQYQKREYFRWYMCLYLVELARPECMKCRTIKGFPESSRKVDKIETSNSELWQVFRESEKACAPERGRERERARTSAFKTTFVKCFSLLRNFPSFYFAFSES